MAPAGTAEKAGTKVVSVVKPDEFTFYEQLPAAYKAVVFRARNKKMGSDCKKIFQAVQSFINRSIHLRRNYKASAISEMEIRMYPQEDFQDAKDSALYAFQLEGKECNSEGVVYVCFFPPYALDGETSISARVYALEVTDKDARDVRRQDRDREDEKKSLG